MEVLKCTPALKKEAVRLFRFYSLSIQKEFSAVGFTASIIGGLTRLDLDHGPMGSWKFERQVIQLKSRLQIVFKKTELRWQQWRGESKILRGLKITYTGRFFKKRVASEGAKKSD